MKMARLIGLAFAVSVITPGNASAHHHGCADFTGGWQRASDGLVWDLAQEECRIAGSEENPSFSHQVNGYANEQYANLQVRRTSKTTGCTNYLNGSAEMVGEGLMRLTLSGSGCDLPFNYSETFTYRRIY